MTQVLNYHDAVVYDTDVALFGDGEWLNDNCINWFFRVLEHEVFPGRTDLLFMDPAVVSCMMNQCDDLEEYEDLGRGLELATRSMVFVPVNNAAGPFSRGSHWSLLVCERGIAGGDERRNRWRFRHFDSSEGSNRTPAELTAVNFVQMLGEKSVGEDKPSRVEHVRDAPQQRNAFDCGMYTILLAERLASKAAAATAAPSQQSSTTPTPPVVASAVTRVPRGNMTKRQDNEAAPAGKGGETQQRRAWRAMGPLGRRRFVERKEWPQTPVVVCVFGWCKGSETFWAALGVDMCSLYSNLFFLSALDA